jgi:hypothetical protein
MTRLFFLAAPLAALAFTAAPTPEPAPVGAPWLSLEIPANPMDPEARDAVFLLHAYYHGNPARFPAVGTAEGLVNGKRQSIALKITETSRAGVYAVKQQWPTEGEWVLSVGVNAGGDGPALLVELGPNGGVESTSFYGGEVRAKVLAVRSVAVLQRRADARTIDQALRAVALKAGDR